MPSQPRTPEHAIPWSATPAASPPTIVLGVIERHHPHVSHDETGITTCPSPYVERRLPHQRALYLPTRELHQPPLYYILAALPVSLVDVDEELPPHYNPHMSRPNAEGGRNYIVHDPAAEAWPYRGTALAVHVARWVSVLLGALGLLFTFLAARALAPGEPWVRWGAVLALAFWPQYHFSTSVINNDLMVTVCATAVTWLLVRVAVAPTPGAMLGLGLAAGWPSSQGQRPGPGARRAAGLSGRPFHRPRGRRLLVGDHLCAGRRAGCGPLVGGA